MPPKSLPPSPLDRPPNDLHWTAFARTLRARNRSTGTIKSYHQSLTDLTLFHNGADLSDLDSNDINEWTAARLGELAATTVAIRWRSCRAFFNWAVREEIVIKSPMTNLTEPKAPDAAPPVLDDFQLVEMLKTCAGKEFEDRRDAAIIRLFCEPGSPRVAEMAGIMLTDLDMRRDAVTVCGKGSKKRTIPFGAKTGQALDRYLRIRSKRKAADLKNLWLGVKNRPLGVAGITRLIARRSALAGIGHVHPHQLRHTAAHVWADSGGSESDAMELFGWSSDAMPRRYGRSAKTERAERAARRASLGDRL